MDLLEPFLDIPEGMSLQGDNGKYWSRIFRDGRQRIESEKSNKDPYTRFLIKKTSDGKRILLQADTGLYCSLILRDDVYYLEAAKQTPDSWCEFDAFSKKGKLVLKGGNSKFLSRIYRDGVQSIEAAKEGIDECCEFTVSTGDQITPTFEILDLTWDSSGSSVIYNPTVVTHDSYINNGSKDIVQEVDLKHTKKSSDTTSWTRAWGFESTLTYKTGVLESAVASFEFQATISYNGSKGKTSTEENTATFDRKITITAAPHKKTVAKLVVKKADNATIPFTAKIRRTNGDGSKRIIHEQGKWTGVSYQSADVRVDEEPL